MKNRLDFGEEESNVKFRADMKRHIEQFNPALNLSAAPEQMTSDSAFDRLCDLMKHVNRLGVLIVPHARQLRTASNVLNTDTKPDGRIHREERGA
ncbi:MAG: hypothetical protein ABI076_12250 [Acidobacteriaceae bacterium]